MKSISKKKSITVSVYFTAFTRLKRAFFRKKTKKIIFSLDGGNTPRYHVRVTPRGRRNNIKGNVAPNQRSKEKRVLHLWIDAELHQMLKRLAKERKKTMHDIVVEFLVTETKNVELTDEDYEEIAEYLRRQK